MGKRRRNNRNRSEKGSDVHGYVENSSSEPNADSLKPEPHTFKFILEGSQEGDDIPPDSNQPNSINNNGQSSFVCVYKPDQEEIRVRLLIPHVSTNREYRLAKRRNDPYHYALWRDAYDSYLWVLFDGFQNILNKFKVFPEEEISFDTFSFFIYEFSSGYISPYA